MAGDWACPMSGAPRGPPRVPKVAKALAVSPSQAYARAYRQRYRWKLRNLRMAENRGFFQPGREEVVEEPSARRPNEWRASAAPATGGARPGYWLEARGRVLSVRQARRSGSHPELEPGWTCAIDGAIWLNPATRKPYFFATCEEAQQAVSLFPHEAFEENPESGFVDPEDDPGFPG